MSLPRLFPSYSRRSALAGAAATSLGLALGPQLARAVARGGHPPRTGRHLKAVVLSDVLLVGLLGSAGAIQTPQATPSAPDGGDTASMYRGDTARTGVFPGPAPSGPPIFLWRYKVGNNPATPGVGDGIVVAQDEAGVAAVDQTTG